MERRGETGKPRAIPLGDGASIGDFQRYPGCRFSLTCALCGWTKTYNPERILERLRQLKSGGAATRIEDVARRVQWPCPGCHRFRWRGGLAWPAGLSAADVRRAAAHHRN